MGNAVGFHCFGSHVEMLYCVGMGPVPWTVNSEIYPLWARSTGISTTTCINWVANLMISLSFLSLTEAITRYGQLCFPL